MGLAVYVAAYDYWAIRHKNETMSEAFGRSFQHPWYRPLTALATLGLLKHLVTPTFLPQLDPFARLAENWRKGVEMIDQLSE